MNPSDPPNPQGPPDPAAQPSPADQPPPAPMLHLNHSSRTPQVPGPDPDALARLKRDHGDVYRLKAEVDGSWKVVIVRVATPGEWGRFISMVGDQRQRAQALDVLLRQVRLWPDVPPFEAMVTAQPGLIETWGNRLTEICGLVDRAEAEKL